LLAASGHTHGGRERGGTTGRIKKVCWLDARISDYGSPQVPAAVTSTMTRAGENRPSSGDAAEVATSDPPQTKEQPGAPVLSAGLVATILTDPPQPVKQHAHIFGAIAATLLLARGGKSVVRQQPT